MQFKLRDISIAIFAFVVSTVFISSVLNTENTASFWMLVIALLCLLIGILARASTDKGILSFSILGMLIGIILTKLMQAYMLTMILGIIIFVISLVSFAFKKVS